MGGKIGPLALSPRAWADSLERARSLRPLVYTITSFVSASFQADGTLAAGGAPVMSRCPEEAAELAASADSLVVNTGTPDDGGLAAMERAMPAGRNIVFDPVGYGATSFRREVIDRLLQCARLSVVKGNYGEILLLAGEKGRVSGVDSGTKTAPSAAAMTALARKTGALICATGPVDLLADGSGAVAFSGGSSLMGRISGGGCLLGSLMGVLIPGDAAAGTSAAIVLLRLAAERAEKRANGPGSFRGLLLDEISGITPDDLLSQGRRMTALQIKGGTP